VSKKRLGRGLDALLSERTAQRANDAVGEAPSTASDAVAAPAGIGIEVSLVHPSPYQPRRHFDAEALQDLADSIDRQGLLQPIVVRARAQGGYELIAGERRWRASQLAGKQTIAAIVRTVTDEEASALALIENMQREDLSAMEEALGLARLRDEFALTQQQIADAVGKSRAAIANLLRLTQLGSVTRGLLESGALEMGHARALLALDGLRQDQLARRVAEQGLSVRQTESLVRKLVKGADQPANTHSRTGQPDRDTLRLEQLLSDHLGAPVSIKHTESGRGVMTIGYSSLEELDGVLRHLGLGEQ